MVVSAYSLQWRFAQQLLILQPVVKRRGDPRSNGMTLGGNAKDWGSTNPVEDFISVYLVIPLSVVQIIIFDNVSYRTT